MDWPRAYQPEHTRPARLTGPRIAAIADLHIRGAHDSRIASELGALAQRADLLAVAGDLTDGGRLIEAEAAADLLALATIPVFVVLGNHDLRTLRRAAFRRAFERRSIEVLDGRATTVRLSDGTRIGIAGTTGCGGGFWPVEGPEAIHARTLKRLALRARRECELLSRALLEVDADIVIAATHFAPTATTLGREPLGKYWMLGNSGLGEAIDRYSPDLVIHGHAHLGILRGRTRRGVPVRNVALPVVGGVHVESIDARSRTRALALLGDDRRWR